MIHIKYLRYLNLFISKLFGQGIKFLLFFYISSKLLSAEEFGVFSLYLVIINLVYLIVGVGLIDTLLFLILKHDDKKQQLLGTSIIYLLIITFFYFIINVLVFSYFGYSNVFLLSFLSAGYLFYLLTKKISVGFQDFFAMNYFDVILNLSTFIIVLFYAETLYSVLIIYSTTMLIISVAFIFRYKPICKNFKKNIKEIFINQKEYGFKVHLSQFIAMFTYDIDKIILKISKGFESVGQYNVILNFIMPVKLFSISISEILLKKFSEIDKIPRKIFLFNHIVSLILSAFVWKVSILVINNFYPDNYQEVIQFSYLIPILSFFSASYIPINYFFTAHGLGKQKLYNAICLGISNVILNFTLIPKYGVQGAMIATILALLINNILFIIQYRVYIRKGKEISNRENK